MNELIKITYNNDRPAVSARDLHDFLEVKTAYKDWFPRMCEYGFTEGEDFNPLKIERVQNESCKQKSIAKKKKVPQNLRDRKRA